MKVYDEFVLVVAGRMAYILPKNCFQYALCQSELSYSQRYMRSVYIVPI